MLVLLESANACQRYFLLFLQIPFGRAECVEDYEKLHRDLSSHRPQKSAISVIRVVPGADEIFVRATGLPLASAYANTSASQTGSSRNESAPTVTFASRLRASPHAVDCD